MEKLTFKVITLLFLLLAIAGCGHSTTLRPQPQTSITTAASYPLTIINYDEQEQPSSYTYQTIPQKVVITHPGATELFIELGLQDHILATVAPYGAPLERIAKEYAKLTIIKTPYTPSQEELLEMEPDMIISWVHQFSPHVMGDVQTWQHRGIGTFILPSTLTKTKPTLETTVYPGITDIGKIFNIQDKTEEYIQQAKNRVTTIEDAVKDVENKKTVLVLQDHSNGTFSLYDSSYLISHMITLAGGENICQQPNSFVGGEKVLAFDPDFIIFVTSNFMDSSKDLTDEEAKQNLRAIKELQSMRAIRADNIINLPFFTVNNGGIRTIDGIEKIAKALYPEKLH